MAGGKPVRYQLRYAAAKGVQRRGKSLIGRTDNFPLNIFPPLGVADFQPISPVMFYVLRNGHSGFEPSLILQPAAHCVTYQMPPSFLLLHSICTRVLG
jgi:hypothetical protein